MKATGYFYTYRCNGYGPFNTEDEALKDYSTRYDNDTWEMKSWIDNSRIRVFYGTVTTNDKKELISVERIKPE